MNKPHNMVTQLLSTVFDKPIVSGFARRLERELTGIVNLNLCNPETMTFTSRLDEVTHEHVYTLTMYHNHQHKWYEFFFGSHYPFAPPRLRINRKSYESYMRVGSTHFKLALGTYIGLPCFCCKTILCLDNWTPILLLKDIFQEVNNFQTMCRQVSLHVIVNVLKRKYLIDDINLLEWLF